MKRTRRVFFMITMSVLLIGCFLFAVSYFSQSPQSNSVKTTEASFQSVDIFLEDCGFSVMLGESTYLSYNGIHQTDIVFSVDKGVLSLSQGKLGDHKVALGGIAKYLVEGKDLAEEKEIILYLSEADLNKPINIVLQDSSLSLDVSPMYLTIHAESSEIACNLTAFSRVDVYLDGCETYLSAQIAEKGFSRKVEAYNCTMTINGDLRANSDFYQSDERSPILILKAVGGKLSLDYPEE